MNEKIGKKDEIYEKTQKKQQILLYSSFHVDIILIGKVLL